ncbi:hypothetical protein CFBP7129_22020 [Agrobacterium tumefaciens]|uniref:Uncharacterized protein n=1 Tax=Agrobacterium tumefaciens TaxID=358 RepID=A0A4D7YMC0_AGRTU|nr:hypothetical protein CFBP7129_22020 [Agrobacterium tumefaciens]
MKIAAELIGRPQARIYLRRDRVVSGLILAPGRLPPPPLFDHAFSVLSRLFPVPAAFFTITGTGVVRTGLRPGILVGSVHRFISAYGYRNDGSAIRPDFLTATP